MQVRVDETLLNDVRFKALARIYDDEDVAIGRCVKAYWLAQKYWRDDRQMIPLKIWELADLNPLVEVDLAVVRDDGVYVKGSAKFFDWYIEKQEAGRRGGKKSAEKRKEKYGSAQPSEANPKQTRSKGNPASKRSSSVSVSVSSSVSKISPNGEGEKISPPAFSAPDFFFHTWNAHRGALAKCTVLNDSRRRKSKARWAEKPDPSYWVTAVQKMAASSFCLQGGWATFDWLVSNDTNHVKVAEGKYDNRDGSDSSGDGYDWDKICATPPGGAG